MITDHHALRTETIPRDMQHRDGQIDALTSTLAAATHGRTPDDICIFGPSGSGKTTLARYALRELRREVDGVQWGYVNCMSEATRTGMLNKIVTDCGQGQDLRTRGTNTDVFVERLRESDDQVIGVFDEVDSLTDVRPLMALLELPNASVIAISTDEIQVFAEMDTQLESRLSGAKTVRLDKYHHEELVDILDYRVEGGLRSEYVEDEALAYIADQAAGDARIAIFLLKHAAEYVRDTDGHERLDVEAVDARREKAIASRKEHHIRSLGTHHRRLFEIIKRAGSVDASTLHEKYEERSFRPKTKRTRRRYLDSLERYGLIETAGQGRGKRYKMPGPTNPPPTQ